PRARINSSGGVVGVLTPTGIADGTVIMIEDAGGAAATNPITLTAAGGSTIDGNASIVLADSGGVRAFLYDADTLTWLRIAVARSRGTRNDPLPYYEARDFPPGGVPAVLTSLNYDQIDTAGAGASIVATGTGFTGKVPYVDGVAVATYVVGSDTQITFTAPAHAAAAAVPVSIRGVGGARAAVNGECVSPP